MTGIREATAQTAAAASREKAMKAVAAARKLQAAGRRIHTSGRKGFRDYGLREYCKGCCSTFPGEGVESSFDYCPGMLPKLFLSPVKHIRSPELEQQCTAEKPRGAATVARQGKRTRVGDLRELRKLLWLLDTEKKTPLVHGRQRRRGGGGGPWIPRCGRRRRRHRRTRENGLGALRFVRQTVETCGNKVLAS